MRTISILLACSILAPTVSAQATRPAGATRSPASRAAYEGPWTVEALQRILEEIRLRLRSHVPLARLIGRLADRRPHYRVLGGTPKTEHTQASPETTPAKKHHHRLLGDHEKSAFPQGTAFVVSGRPVGSKRIRRLARYLAGYLGGAPDDHLERAVEALIVVEGVAARYASALPKMRERIETIRAKATAPGADFAALAGSESDGPSKERGGDLGFFGREDMVPTFAMRAFTLGLGQVSEPFLTQFGYHILKVEAREKGATPAQDRVRVRHILVSYPASPDALRAAAEEVKNGGADLALYDPSWREHLPPAYR